MSVAPKYNPIELRGPWVRGYALDIHTQSSVPLGGGMFDTSRSEVGELVYRLKYKGDAACIGPLVAACLDCIETRFADVRIEAIVGIPPSETNRRIQPVGEVARALSQALGVPDLSEKITKTKETPPLKNLSHGEQRQEYLANAFRVERLAPETILVVDDLYRSGETAKEITNTLVRDGGVRNILLLTLTKTRTRK